MHNQHYGRAAWNECRRDEPSRKRATRNVYRTQTKAVAEARQATPGEAAAVGRRRQARRQEAARHLQLWRVQQWSPPPPAEHRCHLPT
jgi:hypothetical protein